MSEALRSEFSTPFLEPLIVVVSSPRLTLEDSRLLQWDEQAAKSLRALPVVKEVAAYTDQRAPQLRSPSGHETILLVGLKATDVPGQQRAVPIVRATLAPLRTQLTALDPLARYMWKSFPKVFGFVILTTLVLLFFAFRSYILPLKAVIAKR